MAVNLDGAFLTVKYGAHAMRESGGSVVMVGSASGAQSGAGCQRVLLE